ncbi:hypothetical protein ABLO18_16090 [Mycobacterium tuberculosis]
MPAREPGAQRGGRRGLGLRQLRLAGWVLNFGSGVSGLYNTGGLPPGTPAVVSGIGNVTEQLSGLSSAGTALNQSFLIINLGLADVGAA